MFDELRTSWALESSYSYKLAYGLARVFDTPIMTVEVFLVFLAVVDIELDWLLIMVAANLVPSIGFLVYQYRTRRISDLDVTDRKERLAWFWVMAFSFTFTLILISLVDFGIPDVLYLFQVWLVAFGVLEAVITHFWKISAHGMLSTSLAMWMTFLWSPWFAILLFTFVPLIGWGRWRTGKHTVAQIIGGVSLFLVVNSALWIAYNLVVSGRMPTFP